MGAQRTLPIQRRVRAEPRRTAGQATTPPAVIHTHEHTRAVARHYLVLETIRFNSMMFIPIQHNHPNVQYMDA